MSLIKSKLVLIAFLLLGAIPIYFSMPGGDRQFAIVVWLVFCAFVGSLIWFMPILHCPDCGRATKFFDNFRKWNVGFTRTYRHVKCRHCGCVIDCSSGRGVDRIPLNEAKVIDRLVFYFRWRLALFIVGCALTICSVAMGVIIVRILREGNANQERAGHVLLGCGAVFLLGIALVLAGWRLKRKAHRFAEENDVSLQEGIRIRW